MPRKLGFRGFLMVSIALAAPALLLAGTNIWTVSRPSGAVLQGAALVASNPDDPDLVFSAQDSIVYRSIDGGRTWSRIASFDFINGLFVHSTDAAVFVAGARSGSLAGIFKSVDGGATWNQTLSGSFHIFVEHFASSDAHPSTIYASTYDAIYRSDDSGETWEWPTVPRPRIPPVAGRSRPSSSTRRTKRLPTSAVTTTPSRLLAPRAVLSKERGRGRDLDRPLHRPRPHVGVSAIAIDPVHPSTIFVGMTTVPPPTQSFARRTEAPPGRRRNRTAGEPRRSPRSSWIHAIRAPVRGHGLRCLQDSRLRSELVLVRPIPERLRGRLALGRLHGAGTCQRPISYAGATQRDLSSWRSVLAPWTSPRVSGEATSSRGTRTASPSKRSKTRARSSSTPPEGPSDSWLATAISDGPDGLSRVLWVNGDGRASVDIMGSAGSQAVFRFAALPDWSAADVSVGVDGKAHLLWTSRSGAIFLSSVDASGNVTLGPAYGPYGNWTALALADAPDGATWVLWRVADGRSSVSVHHDLVMGGEILASRRKPRTSGRGHHGGRRRKASLLRVGVDGHAEVSTIDALRQSHERAESFPG